MCLSGYGCCAFGGAPLLPGCTLSHRFERQAALYRKIKARAKATMHSPIYTAFRVLPNQTLLYCRE